jgi:hypothetical protein
MAPPRLSRTIAGYGGDLGIWFARHPGGPVVLPLGLKSGRSGRPNGADV